MSRDYRQDWWPIVLGLVGLFVGGIGLYDHLVFSSGEYAHMEHDAVLYTLLGIGLLVARFTSERIGDVTWGIIGSVVSLWLIAVVFLQNFLDDPELTLPYLTLGVVLVGIMVITSANSFALLSGRYRREKTRWNRFNNYLGWVTLIAFGCTVVSVGWLS